MAAHDARGAARRVEQDRLERPAVPPGLGPGGVGGEGRGGAGRGGPGWRRPGPAAPRRGRSPAPRGRRARAGARSCRRARRRRRERVRPAAAALPAAARRARWALRSWTDTRPSANPGRRADRHRLQQADGGAPGRLARQPGGGEVGEIALDRCPPGVDAQGQRRPGVVGGGDRLPAVGPVGLEPLQPPGGMVPAADRLGDDRLDQRFPLAQEAAQDGVDERRRALVAPARGGHRLVDQHVLGIGRLAGGPEQGQGDQQQGVGPGRRRPRGETAAQRLGRAEPAQGVEGERLGARTSLRRTALERGVERFAGADRADRVGGVPEQRGQGQRDAGIC